MHPSLQSYSLWLGSHIWSCAHELEETPCAGRCRAAGFLVYVLLPLWVVGHAAAEAWRVVRRASTEARGALADGGALGGSAAGTLGACPH
jgi:hypothetical protein